MDKTQQKLDFVSAKLGKLLNTSDASTIHTIMVLTGILMVMIMLVIFTWILLINKLRNFNHKQLLIKLDH